MKELPPFLQKLLDRFSTSRDFTISFALHAIVLVVLSGSVLFHVVKEPPDFVSGESFVESRDETRLPPKSATSLPPAWNPTTIPQPVLPLPGVIITLDQSRPNVPGYQPPRLPPQMRTGVPFPVVGGDTMSAGAAAEIGKFTEDWIEDAGSGKGLRDREMQFTAYLGQYQGGDWNSTVRVVNDKIETGSLPNLLYLMSAWSKDKIKTNYKNVQAIKLDSDELFVIKPPFIFLTGTRDFILTDREVANLQKYVRLGGCIWGDSSVPGLRSRFDIAFKREMKRVLPDVNKEFEPLPANHPIFTRTYFPKVNEAPPGLNFYQRPVYALKIYGEIAVLYTTNDYGDMWQVGLNQQEQIDLRRNEHGQYVAINPEIYDNRDVYLRNLSPEAIATSFKFGTNVVIHLLTRWESKVRTAPTL